MGGDERPGAHLLIEGGQVTRTQRILVLGGGVGGLVVANDLRKRLPARHEIVLVNREETFVFAPSLLWLLVGARRPEQISRPLRRLLRRGVTVTTGEIESIAADRREVVVGGRTLSADYLVVALGAATSGGAIPGLVDGGHDLYSLTGVIAFRDGLASLKRGRIAILTAAPAYRCPAAPYEAAMLVEAACRARRVREHVQVDMFTAEPGPMGVAGPQVSAAVRQMVEGKGINYHPEHQVTRVDPSARTIQFSNGAAASYDLLGFVPPHHVPQVVSRSGLCAEGGWIEVDRHTFATRFPNVYAIGDVTSVPLKMGKPLPKAGVFAHSAAQVVAKNIVRAITGRGAEARFTGFGECFIEAGDGKAGFGKGDFYGEPLPTVAVQAPSRRWHLGKVLLEQSWLRGWM
ncbi:MAG: NAD(P)/FAD-dependent oxidoreductase [Candidatus Eisenbacteria bacterium]|uniref:NAD(P)/FAD-dependent oxidoreductase n=1 Tax=Eiseniibacteriota bacterium TaxID=2212470 RepID=A0A849SM66_UNCEI|nr:NAD(P)/FAD-dependent oxidoreductase [Candidatus Eisenbacteria bacterium]